MDNSFIKYQFEKILENGIANGVFRASAAGAVGENGKKVCVYRGRDTGERDGMPVTDTSLFDVASITKSIPASMLALIAIDEKKVCLEESLKEWIPEFDNSYAHKVRLKHLLCHTLDHGYSLSSLKQHPPFEMLKTILKHDLASPPGTKFCYSNATSILLGMFVERVYGKTLDKIAEERIFSRLDMCHTTFSPEKKIGMIVPTEIDDWRGREIRGEVHDESAYVLRKIMVPASAGLFTTLPDLLNFLGMLVKGGKYRGKKIVSKRLIEELGENRLEDIGKWVSLGWQLNQLRFMGMNCSSRTIGKTGFTGCMVVCDLEKRRACALLSNYTYPKRKENADMINVVRRQVADTVFV